MRNLTLIILLTFVFASCRKEDKVTAITENDSPYKHLDAPLQKVQPYITGFHKHEYDTLILKKYKKGSSFTFLFDSTVYPVKSIFYSGLVNDSVADYGIYELKADTDYILTLPIADTSYRISNISHKPLPVVVGNSYKSDVWAYPLTSIIVNGDSVNISSSLFFVDYGTRCLLVLER